MKTPITVYFHSKEPIEEAFLSSLFDREAVLMPTFHSGFEITTQQSFSEVKHILSTAFPSQTYYVAKISIRTYREKP